MLTNKQIERYSRQIIMPEIGGKGQEELLKSKVLVVGAGGLGSAAIQYLACAGVGEIGIVDDDVVDESNLQRQPIHAGRLGMNKARAAVEFVKALNEDVKAKSYEFKLDVTNVLEIINEYDVVLDCTDNFPSRFLLNDACVLRNKPLIHSAVLRFRGELMTILPNKTACYRCVLPKAPPAGAVPSCQEAGVVGITTGFFGVLQAAEAVKLILGKGMLMVNGLFIADLLSNKFEIVGVEKRNSCPACGEESELKKRGNLEAGDYEGRCELR